MELIILFLESFEIRNILENPQKKQISFTDLKYMKVFTFN